MESCDTSEALQNMLQERMCMKMTTNDSTRDQTLNLPAIDIFLNPAKEQTKEKLIKKQKEIANNYFKENDMQSLYSELFRLLWESGWTSSLALAAFVDFAWGSVLCLLPSCFTGSPSNSAGISNFDPEKTFIFLPSFKL